MSSTAGDGVCSLNYSGNYSSLGNWNDNDFGTAIFTTTQTNTLNYVKPSSSSGAIWKYKANSGIDFKDIPNLCFTANSTFLLLQIVLDEGTDTTFGNCWNGASWTTVFSDYTNNYFWEEGINWTFGPFYLTNYNVNTTTILNNVSVGESFFGIDGRLIDFSRSTPLNVTFKDISYSSDYSNLARLNWSFSKNSGTNFSNSFVTYFPNAVSLYQNNVLVNSPYNVTNYSIQTISSEYKTINITLRNVHTNSIISNYSIFFNHPTLGTFNRTSTTGSVIFEVPVNLSTNYNITIFTDNYFNTEYKNYVISDALLLTPITLYSVQAIARFTATDQIGTSLSPFNVTIGATTKLNSQDWNLSTGSYNATFQKAGYTNKTIEINVAALSNQTYSFTQTTENINLTLTFRDEDNNSIITPTQVTFSLISSNKTYLFNTTTGTKNVLIDQVADYYTIQYTAPGYTQRNYVFSMSNRENDNLTLYLSTTANVTYITGRVVRISDGAVLEGAVIKVLKYFPTLGTFNSIAQYVTNTQGESLMDLTFNTDYYKFIIEYPIGTTKLITSPEYIISTTLEFPISDAVIPDYVPAIMDNIVTTLTYNNVSNSFVYTFNNEEATDVTACVKVYQTYLGTKTQVANDCTTSASGVVYSAITYNNQSSYTALGYITPSTGVPQLTDQLVLDKIVQLFGNNGAGIFYLILLILIIAIISSFSPTTAVIITPIGIVIFAVLGLIDKTLISIGTSTLLVCVGLVIGFVIYKRSN
jgi:hypothetical protein